MGDVKPIDLKQINALADFALYSGVGRKTPMGMGMTRRLQDFWDGHSWDAFFSRAYLLITKSVWDATTEKQHYW